MKRCMALFLVFILTGCVSVHHVSPKRFQIEATLMQSFSSSEYIGQADGKAYLLRKYPSLVGKKWNEEILYTELGGLSPEFIRKMQEDKAKR